ncbi:hypothetical protein MPLSOD_150135 [Mesorhizobium sp. SOD10]|nr:hypothetical protein MPLSOD_150135 [Mesorhizobium sp. SOD10]
MEHAQRILTDFALGRRGALRVGMECHPCRRWLTRIATPYLTQWPDVDFDVRTAFRFDGVEALLGYEIDLLITPDPVTFRRMNNPALGIIPASATRQRAEEGRP